MDQRFSGSGPGVQTPDGCSVELYRQLPYMGELDEVAAMLPAGASVLELGCGTGRLSSRLAAFGLRVTGVDESADMLAHLPQGVVSVRSSLHTLALPQTFDVVLLPSQLINQPSAATRQALPHARSRRPPASAIWRRR